MLVGKVLVQLSFRYKLVWVGFLYAVCPMKPSGPLCVSIQEEKLVI